MSRIKWSCILPLSSTVFAGMAYRRAFERVEMGTGSFQGTSWGQEGVQRCSGASHTVDFKEG